MKAFICVIVMAVTTYLVRVLPLVLFTKEIKSRFFKSFLYYIPYAVLSALTFPSIIWSTGSVLAAAIGTAAAIILAYFERSMVVVAIVAIVVVYGCSFFM